MNSTQSLLSTNSESFFSSPIMTTYAGFFLLTVILVSIDIYQTRGGNVTIKKAAIWSVFWFVLAFLFAGSIYLFWDIYAPNSDYTATKSNRVIYYRLLAREITERRQPVCIRDDLRSIPSS